MRTHIVTKTDTLAELSKRYCLPGCMILRANLHIAGDLFIPGLRLQIPVPDFCAKLARHAAQLRVTLEEPEDSTHTQVKQNTSIYTYKAYTLKEGDNVYRLAQKYGTSMSQILRANNACLPEDLLVGQEISLPIPKDGYEIYTVKAMDTLESICTQFEITSTELHKLNNLSVGMYPGMQVIIPT